MTPRSTSPRWYSDDKMTSLALHDHVRGALRALGMVPDTDPLLSPFIVIDVDRLTRSEVAFVPASASAGSWSPVSVERLEGCPSPTGNASMTSSADMLGGWQRRSAAGDGEARRWIPSLPTSTDMQLTSSWLSADDVEKLVDERLLEQLAAAACRPAACSWHDSELPADGVGVIPTQHPTDTTALRKCIFKSCFYRPCHSITTCLRRSIFHKAMPSLYSIMPVLRKKPDYQQLYREQYNTSVVLTWCTLMGPENYRIRRNNAK